MKVILSVLLLACITLIPPSQCSNVQPGDNTLQPQQAEKYVAQGDAHFAQGLYNEALAEYNAAIEYDPGLAAAYWGRGRVYHFDRGLYSKAADDYSRVIELNPVYTEAYFYLGLAHTANGVYDRAIADFSKAIELDPDLSMAYDLRAWCYLYKAQWEQSSQLLLDQLLASDPGLAEAYHGDGWSDVRQPQWELAAVPYLVRDANAMETKNSNTAASQTDKPADPEAGKSNSSTSPHVLVTPLSGPVGRQILIYGWGFRGNEDGITITWDGEIILCNIRAEVDGSLIVDGSEVPYISSAYSGNTRAAVYVPVTTQGQHVLGVYGSSFTPRGIVNDTIFKVTPEIKLSTAPDINGTQVNISGTGFAGNETITFSLDNKPIDITAATDSDGSFTAAFITSTIKDDKYTVTASGDQGNSAQDDFTIPLAQPLPTGQEPDLTEVYHNRGYAHFKKAQWALAIAGLDSVYAKQASLNTGLWNTEWALDKQRQWDMAIADYNTVIKMIDGSTVQQNTSSQGILETELRLALTDYTRAAELSKTPAFIHQTEEIIKYIKQWSKDVAKYDLSSRY